MAMLKLTPCSSLSGTNLTAPTAAADPTASLAAPAMRRIRRVAATYADGNRRALERFCLHFAVCCSLASCPLSCKLQCVAAPAVRRSAAQRRLTLTSLDDWSRECFVLMRSP